MEVAAIIPARMGSTRYPGKPLCDIHGLTMIEHVYRRTRMSDSVDETYVATPDEEIRQETKSFGGNVIMTGSHPRATDRVAEAAEQIDAEIVVVMQGDEPLVYPDMLDDAIAPVRDEEDVKVTNLAKPIPDEEEYRDPNNVKVVVDEDWNALYFSRAPIPNIHEGSYTEAPVYHQVCVIPFERDFLFEFTEMAETELEQVESIDMLRLLENGDDVRLVETSRQTYPIDTPQDHEKVNELMKDDPLFQEYQDEVDS
ncbi:3-deoxy-manno-octulosonate cytidylyltransferase [Halobacterium bonnevillei]|uniref:3-deoxy-manno-octulosonate cytidylyltransferase n=1 Tax=Halobacterium bonnevillei TaxID=2692200 RepID=A0A6B0SQC4_9EURY|nr:3-deoxy-manno-octulosonate cytidylyltransferase [Halobacterium bonnevillei]MXR21050.1 3-deoxy-manno-octulosonate cytidylyltransferase [Halobacterium bonnevillei]